MSTTNLNIDRRDFFKIIFGTVALSACPTAIKSLAAAESLIVHEPYKLTLDCGYFLDPLLDWDLTLIPTYLEKLEQNFPGFGLLSVDKQNEAICEYMGYGDYSEFLYDDRNDWLDSRMDIEDLSMREGAMIGPYWTGIEFVESLSWEEASSLGVYIVEGEHPGSSFMAAGYEGDVDVLNRELVKRGMNLVVD